MSPDAPSAREVSAAAGGDAHALAVALLLVGLAAGALLSRLGTDGPAFPTAPRTEVELSDGFRPAAEAPAVMTGPSNPPRPAPLDLNASDAQALQALPGVGPALAEGIVAYRRAHGPFGAPEDLLQVPGIGPKRWERVRELVRVGEEE